MERKNYYEILGITDEEKRLPEEQFSEVVKKKFRKLSMKYHPDRQIDKSDEEKKEAEERFKDINEANAVLSDPQKRRKYDLGDSYDDDFMPGGFDPFGSYFGRMNNANRVERGDDVQVIVNYTLEESFNGGKHTMDYDRRVPCSECNGTGSADGIDAKCQHCGGTGRITETTRQGNAIYQRIMGCPHCGGTGKHITNKCKKCGGTGFETEHSNVQIEIPKGVFDGAAIRLSGYGSLPKSSKGVPGDLIVVFRETENDYFERDGNDLIHHIYLDLDEAWCGCEKEIKTIEDGKIKIKIPELTKEGKVFRCGGKGMPRVNAYGRGDMYVIVHYKMPDKLTKEQRDLLKKFYDRK